MRSILLAWYRASTAARRAGARAAVISSLWAPWAAAAAEPTWQAVDTAAARGALGELAADLAEDAGSDAAWAAILRLLPKRGVLHGGHLASEDEDAPAPEFLEWRQGPHLRRARNALVSALMFLDEARCARSVCAHQEGPRRWRVALRRVDGRILIVGAFESAGLDAPGKDEAALDAEKRWRLRVDEAFPFGGPGR